MTDIRQQTIDVYNHTAPQMAEKFRKLGVRKNDIDLAFKLAGEPKDARVLEIGCGDGRDAKYIVAKTGNYLGTDVVPAFIELARDYVSEGKFKVADVVSQKFPTNLDLIFAFASLLHLDKDEVRDVLQRAHKSLKIGGIFYISLKWSSTYKQEVKKDEFGERLFYFYNQNLIKELAGQSYEVVATSQENRKAVGSVDWFEIALRKK